MVMCSVFRQAKPVTRHRRTTGVARWEEAALFGSRMLPLP